MSRRWRQFDWLQAKLDLIRPSTDDQRRAELRAMSSEELAALFQALEDTCEAEGGEPAALDRHPRPPWRSMDELIAAVMALDEPPHGPDVARSEASRCRDTPPGGLMP